MSTFKTEIVKDFAAKSILIRREFAAPVSSVWRAFTEAELLDQWWGPTPWRTETKQMDFVVGGSWLYAMVGPEGDRHACRMNYLAIDPQVSFDLEDCFCDENWNPNPNMPVSNGRNIFIPSAQGTVVEMHAFYSTEEQLKMVVEMGFEQGISICLDQLAAMLVGQRA